MEILDVEQGSEEWFLARRGLLTGSRFGKCITPARGALSASHLQVVAECVAEPLDPDSAGFSTYWTERGILMEEEARNWYEFHREVEVTPIGLVRGDGNLAFSPDGFVLDDGMIEVKCPKPSTHVRYLMDGELPPEYKAQVHGGLFVCEREWCDFISYCPGFKPLLIHVEADEFTATVGKILTEVSEKISTVRKEILA